MLTSQEGEKVLHNIFLRVTVACLDRGAVAVKYSYGTLEKHLTKPLPNLMCHFVFHQI